MIPKPHKIHNVPTNFKPISLLSTMSKVFKRILLPILQKHFKPREEQHAFRLGHSTTTQLVKLTDELAKNMNNKRQTAAIFLDVEKAFDRVWHDGLIHKLHTQTDTPKHLIKLIQSFLKDRSFNIKLQDKTSSPKSIAAGVTQGSCLSPLLYSIYINDLPKSNDVTTSLFADDTLFYSSHLNKNFAINRLQRQIDAAAVWMDKWRIRLNIQKSTAVFFNSQKSHPRRKIRIKKNQISWCNQAKYLGVTFDKLLTFNKHKKDTIQKAKRARAMLYPVLNRNCPIPMATRLSIYKIYIKPILLYAITAWGPLLSKTNWHQMEAVQNIALRVITGTHYLTSNKTLLQTTNVPSLVEETIRAAKTFFHRNSMSKHAHIREIGVLPSEENTTRRNRPFMLTQN